MQLPAADSVGPAAEPDADAARRRAAASAATTVSWLWIVPLGGFTAVVAYMSLLFADFEAAGLSGEVSTSVVVLLALGMPSVVFLVSMSAGLLLARSLARFLVVRPWLRTAPSWLCGTGSAVVGGAAAAKVYVLAFESASYVAA